MKTNSTLGKSDPFSKFQGEVDLISKEAKFNRGNFPVALFVVEKLPDFALDQGMSNSCHRAQEGR